MARRSAVAILTAVLVLTALHAAEARRGKWTDMPEALLDIARDHRKALEASLPKRARDVKETAASLDRNTTLYARGLVTRDELGAVAREAGEARAQLEWTRQELTRAAALIAEIETRRRLAHRPPLRPGQYEAGDTFIRFAGHRAFAPSQLVPLEQFFTRRAGRRLPVSAHGQSDVHTRLGLDHRNAVDIAVHPDSVEGRLVMAWLREQGYPFMAFRGARQGAATGAHIHVGAPSERLASARVPERRSRGAAPTVVPARTPAAAGSTAAAGTARATAPASPAEPAAPPPPPPAASLRDNQYPTGSPWTSPPPGVAPTARSTGAGHVVAPPAPATRTLTR